MKRSLSTVALVCLTALGLTSCASIPNSGPVEPGLADLRQVDSRPESDPAGPQAGATQEEIMRGFLLAAERSTDNYAIAREFLASGYAMQWDPYAGVLVKEGRSESLRPDGDDAGMLPLSAVATVDSTGRLLPVGPGESTELRFEFVNEGGEWRISSAPTGIILDQAVFENLWRSRQIYFLGPGGRLVPETRWFLDRTAVSTDVVNTLLGGPSDRLSQSVYTGFPPGVRLTTSVVPVTDGRARVEVSGDGLDSEKTQHDMLLQLTRSLTSSSGVTQVELIVNGTPVPDLEEPDPTPTGGLSATRAAVIIDGEFGVLGAQGAVETLQGMSAEIAALKPNAVVLSRSTQIAAARTSAGVHLLAGGSVALNDARDDLLEPSIDDDDWTWTYSTDAPAVVRVAAVTGEQYELAAPWLSGLDVVALRVAPGGSLIGALVDDGDRSYVLVGGVVRDNDGVPVRLTPGAEIEAWLAGGAIDFDWIDPTRFVALSKQNNAGKVTLGGPGLIAIERGTVPEAKRIVGGGSQGQIRVLTANGELFGPQGGTGWQRMSTSVDLLAKRG